jgi:hypothetical protein
MLAVAGDTIGSTAFGSGSICRTLHIPCWLPGGPPQSSRNWKGGKVQWQSINSYGVTPWANCSAYVVHKFSA